MGENEIELSLRKMREQVNKTGDVAEAFLFLLQITREWEPLPFFLKFLSVGNFFSAAQSLFAPIVPKANTPYSSRK